MTAAMQTVLPVVENLTATPQAFEADVFGAPVWRLEVRAEAAPELRALAEITGRARAQGVALIAVRLADDTVTQAALAGAGFRASKGCSLSAAIFRKPCRRSPASSRRGRTRWRPA